MTNREKIQETFPNMIFIGTVMMYKPTDQVLASGINYNWLNAEYEIPTSSTTKNNLEVDAISRQAVIDELKRYFHDEYYQRTSIQDCRDCFIKDVLNHLPSVTPQEPRWIPVSESLPEESYGCLVTVYDTDLRTQDEFENILPYSVGYDGETWNNADIEQANAAETKKEVAKQNYESGLNDAWECVRKIGKVNWLTLKQIGFEIKDKEKNPSWDVVMEYSASEAITKIKEYEEKESQYPLK